VRFYAVFKWGRALVCWAAVVGCGLAPGAADDIICQRHGCSDDTLPVRGNEEIRFAPPAHSSWLEVGLTGFGFPTPDVCDVLPADATHWDPYGEHGCFPREDAVYWFMVRGCDEGGCGSWTMEYVEFIGQPYACFREGCEEPCYLGAPRRFPDLPACE
jgi:hypothetical protein